MQRTVTIAAVSCLLAGCVDRAADSGDEAISDVDASSEAGESELTGSDGAPDLPDESGCADEGQSALEFSLLADPDGEAKAPALAGDVACTYAEVEALAEGSRRYDFVDCQSLDGGPAATSYALDLATSPDIEPIVDPGTVVRIRFAAEGERWVVTAQPGGLLIFAGQRGALEPETLDVSPLSLAREDPGCELRADDCGLWAPEALVVESEGESQVLVAGDSAVVGESVAYRVNVERFESAASEPSCEGEPLAHYEFVVGLLPSDSP